MENPDALELTALSGRRFATFPAAVLVVVVRPGDRKLLLFGSPAKRPVQGWEVIGGAVEAGETLAEALEREVREEAGPDLEITVVGTIHAGNFRFDAAVDNMISVVFAAAYEGGEVVPSDDLAGCELRWMTLEEVRQVHESGRLFPPEPWLFERALQCLDLWQPTEPPTQS